MGGGEIRGLKWGAVCLTVLLLLVVLQTGEAAAQGPTVENLASSSTGAVASASTSSTGHGPEKLNDEDVAPYERLKSGKGLKPDFRKADNTLVEIKSWSPDALQSSFLQKKLAHQLDNYHILSSEKTWGGKVELWLKGDVDDALRMRLKADLAEHLNLKDVSQLDWLEIKSFQ